MRTAGLLLLLLLLPVLVNPQLALALLLAAPAGMATTSCNQYQFHNQLQQHQQQ
jgi:hypothetical protein